MGNMAELPMFSVAWFVMISGDAGDRAVGSRDISL
jgi:hypothetical protein